LSDVRPDATTVPPDAVMLARSRGFHSRPGHDDREQRDV